MTEVVDIDDVTVVLDDRVVLSDVDLHVSQGEVVAVLGPNGSGKSTLIRAALGLAPVRQGDIRLFGTPISQFRNWQRVGYVPQRSTAASGVPASVREVVAAGRLARRRPFQRADARDRETVEQAIALVGLTDRSDDRVDRLSGGQQQRVLVARAAAGDPDLLVLDEPNAGIDQTSQEAFARALRTFVASDRTVLLVLHQLGPLGPLVDRAVVLDAGRVLREGPLPIPADVTGMPQEHAHSEHRETGLFG
ncbi:MAG: ATP-binding cassette domain-containing protein [Jiangellaceae bacterium]|nr:ATP-binding cassette domain-containing protein [Jiangellaceae bacterium]